MKIKKGDKVLVVSGKDKGKKGKILKAFPIERKVLIESVNLKKRHQKPKKTGSKGQIIQKPAPIDISNVKIICSKCNKPARVGYKVINNKKYRICKKCNKQI
ncbi:MAG: 50S ribosomal protein L24 [Patescibacteria group bacterium]|nr:50S ribosomal protein L24 [Patescibacteria group bacterium]